MHIVIFVTAGSAAEAQKIADNLVNDKLVACANLIDNIKSIFWWQGKLDSANEVLLVMKSKKSKMKKIIEVVKSLHSYETPEIIALPIIAGEKKYLRWIDDSLR